MNFFKYFPTTPYAFGNANGSYVLSLTNTTVHVRLMEALKQHITVLYDYQVQDGERPDTVSVNLYGTPNYTWIVLLLNNIFSLFDWPLTGDEFNAYIAERYTSITNAKTLLLYQTFDGYFVDVTTWTALPVSKRLPAITVYDHELDLNEAKRRIRVVPADFVAPLDLELKKVLSA